MGCILSYLCIRMMLIVVVDCICIVLVWVAGFIVLVRFILFLQGSMSVKQTIFLLMVYGLFVSNNFRKWLK